MWCVHPLLESGSYDWSIIRMSHVLGKAGWNIKMNILANAISQVLIEDPGRSLFVLYASSNTLRQCILTEVLD